ncbi:MAG TPA: dihydrodipicolinate synthase family protein [Terriglobales bacterium]|nr:dihydrodipicolinate synthase family protein [Terriglobales bacterium]
MLLHGVFPPITTPFYPDGNIYWKKLEHNVARYSKTPVAGIVVQGSTGEAILMSDQERRDVLKAAREAASPEKVLIAGTGIESAQETLKLCDYAVGLGYDIAMVRTPHYYKGQMNKAENMLAFYRFVADRSPLPVIIYNFPQATGYNMPTEIVVELAEHPNIFGIKESSGDIEKVGLIVESTRHVQRSTFVTETFKALTPRMLKAATAAAGAGGKVIPAEALGGISAVPDGTAPKPSSFGVQMIGGVRARKKEIGFQVLVGAAQKLAPSMEVGAVGAILAFADAAPTAMYEIYTAWKEGDKQLALEKQEKVAGAAQRIAGEMSIPGVKYAMDLNGYYGGPVRLPLLPLNAELKKEVERLMADIKN